MNDTVLVEPTRPAAAQAAGQDPVFQEPASRSRAEPAKNPDAQLSRDKEKDDIPPIQDGEVQLPSEEDEVLDPREVIARKHEKENYGYDRDAEDPAPEEVPGDKIDTPPVEDELPAPSEPEQVAIKVNGRTLMVDKAKVDAVGGVEFYQKQVAVGDGFKDLAAGKKQLESDRAEFENEKRTAQTQTPGLPPADVPQEASHDLPVSDDQRQQTRATLIKKHREALLDGDDKAADKLMMDLLDTAPVQQPATQSVDPDELEDRVVNKAVALIHEGESNRELRKAGDDFFGDNPELLIDKKLFKSVDAVTNIVADEHPEWDTRQVMDEAYDRVKSWDKGGEVETPNPATPAPVDKVLEKRTLQSPKAGTGRVKSAPAPRLPTDSEYVTQLRKSRGLE